MSQPLKVLYAGTPATAVIPLDALTVQSIESGAFAAAGPVIGLATYDLFEGHCRADCPSRSRASPACSR